jgi:hypothetical protein
MPPKRRWSEEQAKSAGFSIFNFLKPLPPPPPPPPGPGRPKKNEKRGRPVVARGPQESMASIFTPAPGVREKRKFHTIFEYSQSQTEDIPQKRHRSLSEQELNVSKSSTGDALDLQTWWLEFLEPQAEGRFK